MSATYDRIRFIGYAIPTTPAGVVGIGNPNGSGAVAGSYLGDSRTENDLEGRVAVLAHAVRTAKAALPPNDRGVINVLLAPEFFFHGPQGPYIYKSPDQDPVELLSRRLRAAFPRAEYPNWMFVCGTAISSMVRDIDAVLASNSAQTRNQVVKSLSEQWQAAYGPLKAAIFDLLVSFIKICHSHPNCQVRNRSVIVSDLPIHLSGASGPIDLMTTEKYYVSNEDFLLYETTGKRVITEQMTAYAPIDLSGGDTKRDPFDEYAVFRQCDLAPTGTASSAGMGVGIEICLDHRDVRLRRAIGRDSDPAGGIHVQLIPSCGMQILSGSVATGKGGLVFNCDGQYALAVSDGESRHYGQSRIDGVDCLFANHWFEGDGGHAAHTQLARVKRAAVGDNPDGAQSSDADFEPLEASAVTISSVDPIPGIEKYFAGGPGDLHFYGLHAPFAIYP
jgi:hypothetical protein